MNTLQKILDRNKIKAGYELDAARLTSLKADIEAMCMEIIGEDERIDIQSDFDKLDVPHLETDRYPGLDGVRQASRNILRSKQRQRLQSYLKGGK